MEVLQITVTGQQAQVAEPILLTAGTVGLPVAFTFDEDWEELEKIAVFRAGGRILSCPLEQDRCQVPWEIMEQGGCTLHAGAYGCNDDGTMAIPTVWAQVGVIQPGADPEADPGRDPQLPQWQQTRKIAEQAAAVAESVRADADKGCFDGPQGAPGPAGADGKDGCTPVRGVDYWTQADREALLAEVADKVTGDVEAALDEIIAIQEALMGGGGA